MSVLWGTLQAQDELSSRSILGWLAEEGIVPPREFKPGRFPTPVEMRNALDSVENAAVTYYIDTSIGGKENWQAEVKLDGMHLLINDVDYMGHNDVPVHFYYQGEFQLIVTILQKLALVCGAFILHNDSDVIGSIAFILPEPNA